MKILNSIHDNRINSTNMILESTYGEYLTFAKSILKNNDFQRKRVKTSKTVYSLLKNDMKQGCLMPSLVLAITDSKKAFSPTMSESELLGYFIDNAAKVLILDGLQRTYTLLDAEAELSKDEPEKYTAFLLYPLRLEVYCNINKFGILYRMLTLNTGQTPMSARHQLEMLYSDMLDTEVDGMTLIPDNAGKADPDDNQFVFQYVIEGFNSYMNRKEFPIDREELLENVKMLEKISSEDVSSDIFKSFLETYIQVFRTLRQISANYIITEDDLREYEIDGNPFGKKVSKVFSSSQALTGFGAAVGKLKDNGIISSFEDIVNCLQTLKNKNNGHEWLLEMLKNFDIIRNTSKKIGNAQRMYFQYFFRELFNPESDSYLNLSDAAANAYDKYYSQVN